MREWVRADFVKLELEMMPMVKYGIGAWSVLVWTFLSSLSPLRRLAYEFFVLQHIAAAAVFLWLLWVHVPSYAAYNVWFAIGAISFDWILRIILLCFRNLVFRSSRRGDNSLKRIGYQTKIDIICDDISLLTIKDAGLSWKAGQHMYIWIPRLGWLESHPFTIATPYTTAAECSCNDIQLAIRAQSGFTRRLRRYAGTEGRESSLTAFLSGPYGVPPRWEVYETVILISASTGASFTLPILESLLHSARAVCTKRVDFLLCVRHQQHIDYYLQRLSDALLQARTRGMDLKVHIAFTQKRPDSIDSSSISSQVSGVDHSPLIPIGDEKRQENVEEKTKDKDVCCCAPAQCQCKATFSSANSHHRPLDDTYQKVDDASQIMYLDCRPDVAGFIRGAVEATGGETAVAVCAGKSLVSSVRNIVASLSDERAVHKGTGAQGIHLHVEEYSL